MQISHRDSCFWWGGWRRRWNWRADTSSPEIHRMLKLKTKYGKNLRKTVARNWRSRLLTCYLLYIHLVLFYTTLVSKKCLRVHIFHLTAARVVELKKHQHTL